MSHHSRYYAPQTISPSRLVQPVQYVSQPVQVVQPLTQSVIVQTPRDVITYVEDERHHHKKVRCAKKRDLIDGFMHWFFGEQDCSENEKQYHTYLPKKDYSHHQTHTTKTIQPHIHREMQQTVVTQQVQPVVVQQQPVQYVQQQPLTTSYVRSSPYPYSQTVNPFSSRIF